jgi:hypothetical protein
VKCKPFEQVNYLASMGHWKYCIFVPMHLTLWIPVTPEISTARALDAGAELYDVQAALGHKTPIL